MLTFFQVNKKSYSKSEEGIIVNNGPLNGGVQIASFTMFWIDFVPGVSKVILSFDNGTEIEIPPPTKLGELQYPLPRRVFPFNLNMSVLIDCTFKNHKSEI